MIGILILGSQVADLGTFFLFLHVVPGGIQYEANPLIRLTYETGGFGLVATFKLGIGLFAAISADYAIRGGGRVARVLLTGAVALTVLAAASNVLSLAIAVN
jgi:hypothetical protein